MIRLHAELCRFSLSILAASKPTQQVTNVHHSTVHSWLKLTIKARFPSRIQPISFSSKLIQPSPSPSLLTLTPSPAEAHMGHEAYNQGCGAGAGAAGADTFWSEPEPEPPKRFARSRSRSRQKWGGSGSEKGYNCGKKKTAK